MGLKLAPYKIHRFHRPLALCLRWMRLFVCGAVRGEEYRGAVIVGALFAREIAAIMIAGWASASEELGGDFGIAAGGELSRNANKCRGGC